MASICDVPGCGRELPVQSGPGRPRKRCDTCKPGSPARRLPGEPPPTRLTVVNLPRPTGEPAQPTATPTEAPDNLVESTLTRLRAARREGTPEGMAALLAARRLEHAIGDTASGMAALMKEFRATLSAALAGAVEEEDELDAIRKRHGREVG